jgi:hypothetical protein
MVVMEDTKAEAIQLQLQLYKPLQLDWEQVVLLHTMADFMEEKDQEIVTDIIEAAAAAAQAEMEIMEDIIVVAMEG